MKGKAHYLKDGTPYKGESHKMKNGEVHTGKTHSSSSKKLFHMGELSKAAQKKAQAGKDKESYTDAVSRRLKNYG